MQRVLPILLVAAAGFLAGCSTTQEVTLTKASYSKKIESVAQVQDLGN
jgi:PBP1b-binding outer membrane lipoprotein LpoB